MQLQMKGWQLSTRTILMALLLNFMMFTLCMLQNPKKAYRPISICEFFQTVEETVAAIEIKHCSFVQNLNEQALANEKTTLIRTFHSQCNKIVSTLTSFTGDNFNPDAFVMEKELERQEQQFQEASRVVEQFFELETNVSELDEKRNYQADMEAQIRKLMVELRTRYAPSIRSRSGTPSAPSSPSRQSALKTKRIEFP